MAESGRCGKCSANRIVKAGLCKRCRNNSIQQAATVEAEARMKPTTQERIILMRSAAEPLYVVTLIDNVPSILIRGLLCRDELEKQCIPYRSERPYKGDPNEVTAWHGGTTSDKNPILFLDPCATY